MAAGGIGSEYSGGAPANDRAWRVDIAPRPSPLAGAWVLAVLVAALAALALADLPHPWRAALAIAVLLNAVRVAVRFAHREGRGAVQGFTVGLSGHVEVRVAGSPARAGRLVDGSFVAPWLTVVRWRPEGARRVRTLVLLPDMAGEQALRRLRVILRWGGPYGR